MFSNARQSIPKLFHAIMENDDHRAFLRSLGPAITKGEWRELKRLNREKKDFRRAAEKALHWNADKGALA
jgi:hypothetical protein